MGSINSTLNDVFRNTPLGDIKSSIGLSLYGINHRQTPLAVPINRDFHGYVFFTRPQLNLSTSNLRAVRRFVPMLDKNELSLPRVLRRYLDPRLTASDLPCPLVDDKQVFIPILSNHLSECSGWPDPVLDLHTSRPGAQREVFSLADSVIDNFTSYDLAMNFRNTSGDPITALFDYWMWYQSRVFSGEMIPYPDFIALNEIDYQTRVYRLVMDRTKRYVQKIACCGVATPRTNPIGAAFNFEADRPLNQTNDRIQITMNCVGFCYNDPIIIEEFNSAVCIFNPDLTAARLGRQPDDHVLLKPAELQIFNSSGYPLIDPDTYELKWFVSKAEYSAKLSGFNRAASALGLPS